MRSFCSRFQMHKQSRRAEEGIGFGVHLWQAADRDAHEEAPDEQPGVRGHNARGERAHEAHRRADLHRDLAADAVCKPAEEQRAHDDADERHLSIRN